MNKDAVYKYDSASKVADILQDELTTKVEESVKGYETRSIQDYDEVDYIVVEFEKDHISSSFDIIGPYEITERPIKIVANDDMVMITTTSFISPE